MKSRAADTVARRGDYISLRLIRHGGLPELLCERWGDSETFVTGLVAEKYNLPSVLPYRQHGFSSAVIAGALSNCPDDGRKYPLRRRWSELQRYDRIAAGYASHPSQRNKFFLLA